MYAQFTDRARKAMQLATQEAQRFNHEYVGTEHLLLGLVKEENGVAANVFRKLDIDLRKLRLEVMKVVQPGPDVVRIGHLPQTPRAKRAIEYAIEEAGERRCVGTKHLLLGLLRDRDGLPASIFMNLGLKIEDIWAEAINQTDEDSPGTDVATGLPPTQPLSSENSLREDAVNIRKPEATAREVFFAWEKLRLLYNLVLLVVVAVRIGPAMIDLLPNLIEAAIMANLCFCFGPVVEGYANWCGMSRKPARFWIIFSLGQLLSIFYTVGVANRMMLGLPIWPGFPNG